jgi:hypothetical protein
LGISSNRASRRFSVCGPLLRVGHPKPCTSLPKPLPDFVSMLPPWAKSPKQQYGGAGRGAAQRWPKVKKVGWAPWACSRCGNQNTGNACVSCNLGWWDQWKNDGAKKDQWSKGPPSWLKGSGRTTEDSSNGSGSRSTDSEEKPQCERVQNLEKLLHQLGSLEQSDPDLYATLQEQLKEQLAKARSEQPLETKLGRLRSLTDKASYKKKQAEKTRGYADKLQAQLDATREKLLALEAEIRSMEQERRELLQECQIEQDEEDGTGSERETEAGEDIEELKRDLEEAEQKWQSAISRRALRAKAKRKSRSSPYGSSMETDLL